MAEKIHVNGTAIMAKHFAGVERVEMAQRSYLREPFEKIMAEWMEALRAGIKDGARLGLETSPDIELEALVSCMRTSAQDTLEALRRAGWKLVRA